MDEQSSHSMTLEASGSESLHLVQSLLQSVDLNGDVTSISISIESSSPISPPSLTADSEDADDDSLTDEGDSSDTDEEDSETLHVRFHEDSDTLHTARTLYERYDEGFLSLSEVQQFVPNEHSIPDEKFSQLLYNLAERGLVEKRPMQSDGRKKEYRLTEKGREALEREGYVESE